MSKRKNYTLKLTPFSYKQSQFKLKDPLHADCLTHMLSTVVSSLILTETDLVHMLTWISSSNQYLKQKSFSTSNKSISSRMSIFQQQYTTKRTDRQYLGPAYLFSVLSDNCSWECHIAIIFFLRYFKLIQTFYCYNQITQFNMNEQGNNIMCSFPTKNKNI